MLWVKANSIWNLRVRTSRRVFCGRGGFVWACLWTQWCVCLSLCIGVCVSVCPSSVCLFARWRRWYLKHGATISCVFTFGPPLTDQPIGDVGYTRRLIHHYLARVEWVVGTCEGAEGEEAGCWRLPEDTDCSANSNGNDERSTSVMLGSRRQTHWLTAASSSQLVVWSRHNCNISARDLCHGEPSLFAWLPNAATWQIFSIKDGRQRAWFWPIFNVDLDGLDSHVLQVVEGGESIYEVSWTIMSP